MNWASDPNRYKNAALLLAFSVLYFAFILLGYEFYFTSEESNNVAVFWPSSGLFMGVLMVNRLSRWPWIILAALAGEVGIWVLMYLDSLHIAFLFMLVHMLEAVAGAFLVRKLCNGRPELNKLANIIVLIVFAGMLGTLLSAIGGSATATTLFPDTDYWSVFKVWWYSNSISVLVVAPVVIALNEKYPLSFNYRRLRALELIGLWAGLLFCVHMVFGTDAETTRHIFNDPYILFPFMLCCQ